MMVVLMGVRDKTGYGLRVQRDLNPKSDIVARLQGPCSDGRSNNDAGDGAKIPYAMRNLRQQSLLHSKLTLNIGVQSTTNPQRTAVLTRTCHTWY